MNLVLVGFMASGKSSIGRRLSKRLGYRFLDTDSFIESELGCTIAELFSIQGEAYFRGLETKLLANLSHLENHIIATGGGIITTPGNMDLLKKIGPVVFLDADPQEIIERLQRDTRRPMVRGGNLEEKVTGLLTQRRPLYREADITLETVSKSVNETATAVLVQVNAYMQAAAAKAESMPAPSPRPEN